MIWVYKGVMALGIVVASVPFALLPSFSSSPVQPVPVLSTEVTLGLASLGTLIYSVGWLLLLQYVRRYIPYFLIVMVFALLGYAHAAYPVELPTLIEVPFFFISFPLLLLHQLLIPIVGLMGIVQLVLPKNRVQ